MFKDQFFDEVKPLQAKPPKESGTTLALIYFFLAGATTEIAPSSALNAIDYFAAEFPTAGVSFVLPAPFFLGMLIACLVITKISNTFSYTCRMTTSMLFIIVLLALAPFEARLFAGTTFGIALLVVMVFALGFFSNVIYASLGGITSQIDNKFIVSFLIGAGISNLLTTLIREIILIIFEPTNNGDLLNVAVFLIIISGIVGLCLILHLVFVKSEFYKSHWASPIDVFMMNEEAFLDYEMPESAHHPQNRDFKSVLAAIKTNWLMLLYLVISMAQMGMVYPGLMFLKPVAGLSAPTKTVSMMATFHVFIIMGKILGQYRKYYGKLTILFSVIVRFALLAFFIIQAETVNINVFNTVWFGYLNIAIFGLTTGFVVCAAFLVAAEQAGAEKKEVSGFVSVSAVTLGIGVGDGLALIFIGLKPPQ